MVDITENYTKNRQYEDRGRFFVWLITKNMPFGVTVAQSQPKGRHLCIELFLDLESYL